MTELLGSLREEVPSPKKILNPVKQSWNGNMHLEFETWQHARTVVPDANSKVEILRDFYKHGREEP